MLENKYNGEVDPLYAFVFDMHAKHNCSFYQFITRDHPPTRLETDDELKRISSIVQGLLAAAASDLLWCAKHRTERHATKTALDQIRRVNLSSSKNDQRQNEHEVDYASHQIHKTIADNLSWHIEEVSTLNAFLNSPPHDFY